MMRFTLLFFTFFLAMACDTPNATHVENSVAPVALVIHGGAGAISKEFLSEEQEAAYHAALKKALEAGFAVLDRGGKSVDAVIAAIVILEDSPLFNAGKGAVFTADGRNELDASLMDGSNLKAGAVAGVTTIKNPIKAAYTVMTDSEHVMLAGEGADVFAKSHGLEIVEPGYFVDSTRYQQFLKSKKSGKLEGTSHQALENAGKFGTVGAVALDRFGNIAAGTSTGGMSNKRFGRVGDSPVIGAGTYANNRTCAVSGTGWGEYFIRLVIAHDISAMMEYGHLTLQQAADSVIMKKLPALGGSGGVIALDNAGNIAMPFNTKGMYRGYIRAVGEAKTFLYGEDEN